MLGGFIYEECDKCKSVELIPQYVFLIKQYGKI